jgi:proteasome accessory factor B
MKNVLERVLNLLAYLLTSRRPVTAEEIRSTVAGYDQESDEAFRRMFERDKELLRRLGIPLQLRPTDAWEVEFGYVIPPEEYRLPDPGLTDEERAALWLAAQVVRIGGRPSAAEALLKLGGTRMTGAVEPFAADLGAEVDMLADLYAAVVERRFVDFAYKGRRRRVAPHGLGHRRGHWYLVGLESGDVRVYRVDRMEVIEVGATPGAFPRRAGISVRKVLDAEPWEAGGEPPTVVTVRFDPEVAWWASRRLGSQPLASREEAGHVEVDLEVRHLDAFLGWVLGFGDHAEVTGPPAVRARVVARVQGVA